MVARGMQTGLQDAGNLGWKLTAQIHGWAPRDWLDTYHAERRPIAQRLITFSRAQEALAGSGEHITALREVLASAWAIRTSIRTLWNNQSRWNTQRIPGECLVATQRHSERHSCSLFCG
jgi:2-polyprenyl-6-methoxyphenol hydroxylase-like FAD-dependent oxidoreductase